MYAYKTYTEVSVLLHGTLTTCAITWYFIPGRGSDNPDIINVFVILPLHDIWGNLWGLRDSLVLGTYSILPIQPPCKCPEASSDAKTVILDMLPLEVKNADPIQLTWAMLEMESEEAEVELRAVFWRSVLRLRTGPRLEGCSGVDDTDRGHRWDSYKGHGSVEHGTGGAGERTRSRPVCEA